jgi:hypothetical protein
MDEAEWLACDDPEKMLRLLQASSKPSGRKARLFAAACCLQVWSLLATKECRQAVYRAAAYVNTWQMRDMKSVVDCAQVLAARPDTAAQQCTLLRDIIGKPFSPVALDPAWRTSTVTALATAAYEERTLPAGTFDSDRLAVLADALEDAGSDNADLLSHLRGSGPHVRGCWVVDLLLGKE